MDKKKILLIDDEVDFSKFVKENIEHMSEFQVEIAATGIRGMEMAKELRPDIILLDVLMPEIDGYTILKELRLDEATKDIPVVILTAKSGMEELFEAERLTDYIVKPFEIDVLLKTIEKKLGE